MPPKNKPRRNDARAKKKETAAELDARELAAAKEVLRRLREEDGPPVDPEEIHREHMRLEKLYGHLVPKHRGLLDRKRRHG